MASAKKLPSGNWRVNLFIGYDENKKRKFKSFTAPTKKEAEYLAAEYNMFRKQATAPENITVEAALERYISSKRNVLSPSTIHGYETILKNRLQNLRPVRLGDLTQEKLQQALNTESLEVSRKTLTNAYGLLTSALKFVYPDFHFTLTYPAKKRVFRELPSAESIMKAVYGSNVEIPVLFALWLGMRISEIKGLQYGDISDGCVTIQRAMLKVGKEYVVRENTKTYNSTRKLKLPQRIIDLIGDGSREEYVVKESGATISERLEKVLKNNNIPHMRFHDLRHLNASIMLQLGIPDKYAMERGGWSTNQTLKNVYQHTFSAERQIVDDKIDQFFENIQHEIQHENEKHSNHAI